MLHGNKKQQSKLHQPGWNSRPLCWVTVKYAESDTQQHTRWFNSVGEQEHPKVSWVMLSSLCLHYLLYVQGDRYWMEDNGRQECSGTLKCSMLNYIMAAHLYATVHILWLIQLKVTHFNLYKLYHTGPPLANKKRQLSLLTAGCKHQNASSLHQRPLSLLPLSQPMTSSCTCTHKIENYSRKHDPHRCCILCFRLSPRSDLRNAFFL